VHLFLSLGTLRPLWKKQPWAKIDDAQCILATAGCGAPPLNDVIVITLLVTFLASTFGKSGLLSHTTTQMFFFTPFGD
jgi:hypothetical protein